MAVNIAAKLDSPTGGSLSAASKCRRGQRAQGRQPSLTLAYQYGGGSCRCRRPLRAAERGGARLCLRPQDCGCL